MIRYFDASALVKRYVQEPGSEEVEALVRAGVAATCRYTHVEILSALARRARAGDVAPDDRRRALASVRGDFERLTVVELTREVVGECQRLLDRHPLRAGDALQVASCVVLRDRLGVPVSFVAFDDRCSAAARAEGLAVEGG